MIKNVALFLMTLPFLVHANEGMWMPHKIDSTLSRKMTQMGYRQAPDSVYNNGNGGLTDAVIVFGPGCTGEVVSDKGLIFTNHHCGFGSVQQISTVENDYLYEGYWAKSAAEEIHVPNLTVKFLRGIYDVTDAVLGCLPDTLPEQERTQKTDSLLKALKVEWADTSDLLIEIKPFYNGLQYYATFQEVYTDVRLVGTPPVAIGKYGGDTDNWMWPRHTGDFSVWRVYADSTGKPADYSENNRPLTTNRYLPISLNGVEENDFTMTIGYPGSTKRYLSSWGIKERMQAINQTLIDVRGVKQQVWANRMASSNEIRLKYANKYFRSSNYWKNSIGMNRGIQRLKVLDNKRALERDVFSWADKSHQTDIEVAIEPLADAYEMRYNLLRARMYLRECFMRGAEIYAFSERIVKLLEEQNDTITNEKELAEAMDKFYKDYDVNTDKEATLALIKYFSEKVETAYFPEFITPYIQKCKVSSYGDKLFAKSLFVKRNLLEKAISKGKLWRLKNDLAYQGYLSINAKELLLKEEMKPFNNMVKKGERALMQALLLMDTTNALYPDANFTMRLSLGQVASYKPRDAVDYNYYTTTDGVLEKYLPGDIEFDLPQAFVEQIKGGDYGIYADDSGMLQVCFISTNDITGGNSGSPVINGNGQLLGLAFDGNWEAMSGDIAFEPDLQRTIAVDIRYVLYIIDTFGNCGYLLKEMDIIKSK